MCGCVNFNHDQTSTLLSSCHNQKNSGEKKTKQFYILQPCRNNDEVTLKQNIHCLDLYHHDQVEFQDIIEVCSLETLKVERFFLNINNITYLTVQLQESVLKSCMRSSCRECVYFHINLDPMFSVGFHGE